MVGTCFMIIKEEWDSKKAIEAGEIQIGISSSDMEGKKYQGIIEQLEEIGFVNIKTIDMDDAGIFTNRSDTIERVTIDGTSSFSASEYFNPDSKIIISFH